MTSNAKEIALKFVECINKQDLDGLIALMTDEHTFIGFVIGDVTRGREKMIEGYTSYF
jgi:ketosteroid isomerase-like protein